VTRPSLPTPPGLLFTIQEVEKEGREPLSFFVPYDLLSGPEIPPVHLFSQRNRSPGKEFHRATEAFFFFGTWMRAFLDGESGHRQPFTFPRTGPFHFIRRASQGSRFHVEEETAFFPLCGGSLPVERTSSRRPRRRRPFFSLPPNAVLFLFLSGLSRRSGGRSLRRHLADPPLSSLLGRERVPFFFSLLLPSGKSNAKRGHVPSPPRG